MFKYQNSNHHMFGFNFMSWNFILVTQKKCKQNLVNYNNHETSTESNLKSVFIYEQELERHLP